MGDTQHFTADFSDYDLVVMQRQISVDMSRPPRKCRRCKCVLRAANAERRICSPCLEAKWIHGTILQSVTSIHTGDYLTLEIVEKFWTLAQRNGRRRCWGWKGYITQQGYAVFAVQRRILYARRVVYQIATGASPPSFLYNVCRNNGCTNPRHIKQGRTQRR